MTTDLDAPQSEQPDAPKPACCPWRMALQVPLLLAAAAGLGFAGQQAWQSRTDLQSLWPYSTACLAGASSGCTSSGHAEGCSSAASVAASYAAAERNCGSSTNAVAEVEMEDSVSALSPENAVDEL
jgi:hypothetical protein